MGLLNFLSDENNSKKTSTPNEKYSPTIEKKDDKLGLLNFLSDENNSKKTNTLEKANPNKDQKKDDKMGLLNFLSDENYPKRKSNESNFNLKNKTVMIKKDDEKIEEKNDKKIEEKNDKIGLLSFLKSPSETTSELNETQKINFNFNKNKNDDTPTFSEKTETNEIDFLSFLNSESNNKITFKINEEESDEEEISFINFLKKEKEPTTIESKIESKEEKIDFISFLNNENKNNPKLKEEEELKEFCFDFVKNNLSQDKIKQWNISKVCFDEIYFYKFL
jgi:hypothetical protein